MALAYLPLEEARNRISVDDVILPESLSDPISIESLIERIEIWIDSFLNRRLAATKYDQTIASNHRGIVVLPEIRVINIVSVKALYPMPIQSKDEDIAIKDDEDAEPYYDLKEIVQTCVWDGKQAICTYSCAGQYRVVYWAGYRPVPQLVTEVAYNMLRGAIAHGGDLGFLTDVTKDLTSVSLPGGLSQSFQRGQSGSGDGIYGDGTNLKRLLGLLYRNFGRTILW